METIRLVIPTTPATILEIPGDYPIPPPGADFWLKFENYIRVEETWKLVLPLLNEDSLTVAKVDGRTVFLQIGQTPGIEEPDREYLKDFEEYWSIHPEEHPFQEL